MYSSSLDTIKKHIMDVKKVVWGGLDVVWGGLEVVWGGLEVVWGVLGWFGVFPRTGLIVSEMKKVVTKFVVCYSNN